MSGSESFLEGSHLVAEGNPPSLSELLFSNDDDEVGAGVDMAHASRFSSTGKSPRMLCFGGYTHQNESETVMFSEATKTTLQISGVTCSDTSSASSGNNCNGTVNAVSTVSKSNGSIWLKFAILLLDFSGLLFILASFAEKKKWVKPRSNSEEY